MFSPLIFITKCLVFDRVLKMSVSSEELTGDLMSLVNVLLKRKL